MTAIERVRRTQRSLEVVVASSVLFWGAATLFALLTIGAAIGGLIALPPVVRALIPIIAILVALTVLSVLAWRGRFVWYFDRVALWIEERFPELRYTLVTAIDPRYQGATAKLMEPAISRADPAPFVRKVAQRSILPALLALVIALGAFSKLPPQWRKQLSPSGILGTLHGRPTIVGNRLNPIFGTLTPPAYSHLRTENLSTPKQITGLVGSQVVLTGYGSPDGIQATITEFPSEEPINAPLGDSANDDAEQYEEAQAAAQQKQGGSPDQNGGGQGMGMPGMPGGGMSRQDQPAMRSNNPEDQGGLGGRSMGGGMNGLGQNGVSPSPAPSNQQQQGQKPAKKHGKPYVRPVVRQQTQTAIVKPVQVTAGGKGWIIRFALADSNPALLHLADRQYKSDIVINPQVDQPPTGRLLLPARDTTLRIDTVRNIIPGTLTLSAIFNDDIGLAEARFEYIKCSFGTSDEDVKCIPGVYTKKAFGDAKSGEFSYSIPFADLHLKEGDQLSVRAVVTDNNTLTGPDTGFTETRTIRIARKSEYQKLNVNPAPPSADTALVTMRMLLMAVKQLEVEKVEMEHQTFMDSSIKLGGLAQQVKNKVDQIIDEQTGGGEVPVNPLLAFTRDSMQDVITDLYIGDTHASIPPLQASYDSLMKFTNTGKYYIRGPLDAPPVNIERVRLKGTDSGSTTPRTPRPLSNQDREEYMREYTMGVQQLRTSPDDALHALTLLQVKTLKKYPNLSAAIADAISAVSTKHDPGPALLRARKILNGSSVALDTLPLWSGAW